jgi:hypothetical protein
MVMLPDPSKAMPLIVLGVWSLVAVKAFPASEAVIVLAEKLPVTSLETIAPAVLAETALTDQVTADEPLYGEPIRWEPLVKEFGETAVMVMLPDPSKAMPLIVLGVSSFEAVKAFPTREAVITLAEKLPEPSRATIAPAVLADAALTAQVMGDEPL